MYVQFSALKAFFRLEHWMRATEVQPDFARQYNVWKSEYWWKKTPLQVGVFSPWAFPRGALAYQESWQTAGTWNRVRVQGGEPTQMSETGRKQAWQQVSMTCHRSTNKRTKIELFLGLLSRAGDGCPKRSPERPLLRSKRLVFPKSS